MKLDKALKIVLITGIILTALLALRSFKQFIYLSFSLLSLKIVWFVVIIIFISKALRKWLRASH